MFSSNDVFQGNAAPGVDVGGSYFQASNSNFLNNAVGLRVGLSTVQLRGGTISGNLGDGMTLLGSASVAFFGPTITGNGANGVHLEDGAFAGFVAAFGGVAFDRQTVWRLGDFAAVAMWIPPGAARTPSPSPSVIKPATAPS